MRAKECHAFIAPCGILTYECAAVDCNVSVRINKRGSGISARIECSVAVDRKIYVPWFGCTKVQIRKIEFYIFVFAPRNFAHKKRKTLENQGFFRAISFLSPFDGTV